MIWLPNRDAVAIDIATWPAFDPQLTPAAFIESVRQYVSTRGDNIMGRTICALGDAAAMPFDDGRFDLATSAGTRFVAKAVVIAAGLGSFQPRRPEASAT